MSVAHNGCNFCLFLSICWIRGPHLQHFPLEFNYKEILCKKITLIVFLAFSYDKLRYNYISVRGKHSIESR